MANTRMTPSTATTKPVRDGNIEKRSAILVSARELFLRDGIDHVSMDAIASAANVSKRTVYDYFGDKRRLLASILDEAGTRLLTALQAAIQHHLADEPRIENIPALESALFDLVMEISVTLIASADYATFTTLNESSLATEDLMRAHPLGAAPEEALEERLNHFSQRGLLDIDDLAMATDHFVALTLLLTHSTYPDPTNADLDEIRRIMAAGAQAFLRAYGSRD